MERTLDLDLVVTITPLKSGFRIKEVIGHAFTVRMRNHLKE